MKSKFRHQYPLTVEELKTLWEDAIFVIDTNVLLHMYRYTENTRNQYIEVFKLLGWKGRLFLPNQVCEEFFRNRLNVVWANKKQYAEIITALKKVIEQINIIRNHPNIDLESIKSDINRLINEVQTKDNESPSFDSRNDPILEEISLIFDDCIWEWFNNEEICKIEKEWEVRYRNKVPPWFQDSQKPDNKYGDLILWREILELSKEKSKWIIFITDDVKKDWWLEHNWQTIMPLPQLRKELFDISWKDFHIYTPENFLDHIDDASINSDAEQFTIDSSSIEEVKNVWLDNSFDINSLLKPYISEIQNVMQALEIDLMLNIENEDIEKVFWIRLAILNASRNLKWEQLYLKLKSIYKEIIDLLGIFIDKYEWSNINKSIKNALNIISERYKSLINEEIVFNENIIWDIVDKYFPS